MPAFLEKKLKKQYPGNNNAVFGTMNKIGAMDGPNETEKGEEMQEEHDMKKKKPSFGKMDKKSIFKMSLRGK